MYSLLSKKPFIRPQKRFEIAIKPPIKSFFDIKVYISEIEIPYGLKSDAGKNHISTGSWLPYL